MMLLMLMVVGGAIVVDRGLVAAGTGVALVGVDVSREVALAVPEGDVRPALGLLEVQRLVQVVVHEVVLRALLAVDLGRPTSAPSRGHADQVDLVEGEALRTYPGVAGVVLAVVENLAVQLLIGVVARLLAHAVELALGQQQAQPVRLLLLQLLQFQLVCCCSTRSDLYQIFFYFFSPCTRRRTCIHPDGLSISSFAIN